MEDSLALPPVIVQIFPGILRDENCGQYPSLGDRRTMFKTTFKTASQTRFRPWLFTALPVLLSLTVSWAVRAATDPAPSAASTPSAVPTPNAAYAAPAHITGPTTAFHESIAARYNYAFGKDSPFLPSNATSANGQFFSPKSFPTAQYCGHCHKEAYRQWRQSVHSNSFRAPWYLKNVNMLIDEKGVQYSRHCEGCHNPVAQKAPLRGRRAHLLGLPLHPVGRHHRDRQLRHGHARRSSG